MSKHGEVKLCLLVLLFAFSLIPTAAPAQEGCIAPTVTKEVKDIERYLGLAWSPANPDEIQPGTSNEVRVTGGLPPLAWSVSGTGFSLEKVQGQNSVDHERSKLLKASPTSCGTATITVTDKYDDEVTGYVRGSVGKWEFQGNICGLSGMGEEKGLEHVEFKPGGFYKGSIWSWELISGYQKQLQITMNKCYRDFGKISCYGGCADLDEEICPKVSEHCPGNLSDDWEDYMCEEFGDEYDTCCIGSENCIDPQSSFEDWYDCLDFGPFVGTTWWFASCVTLLRYYEWTCPE